MSQQGENRESVVNDEDRSTSSISPAMIGWGVAAAVLAIVSVALNTSSMALSAGWFAKCVAVLKDDRQILQPE